MIRPCRTGKADRAERLSGAYFFFFFAAFFFLATDSPPSRGAGLRTI
jgi:hypothetical protein